MTPGGVTVSPDSPFSSLDPGQGDLRVKSTFRFLSLRRVKLGPVDPETLPHKKFSSIIEDL